MKKSTRVFLAVAALIALTGIIGCNDNKNNTDSKDGLTGEYVMSEYPLSSYMEAVNPEDTALTIKAEPEVTLTFAQVIMAAYNYVPSIETGETKVVFQDEGILTLTEIDEGKELHVFPNPEAGLQASYVSYSFSGDNLILTFSPEMTDFLLKKAPAENVPQIKALLPAFTRGVVVYDPQAGSAKINLKYRKGDRSLFIYIDKTLIEETWICAKPVASQIVALVELMKPGSTMLAQSILTQIEPMLAGFTKIEVGATMTKQ